MPHMRQFGYKRHMDGGDRKLEEDRGLGCERLGFAEDASLRLPAALDGFDPARRLSGRVAYLINAYPKISHSFIRTEIGALERLGLEVSRFTIRRTHENFADDIDRKEAERTTALLDGNWAELAGAVLRSFLRRPGRTVSALRQSLRSTADSVRALAYFAEAAALSERMAKDKVRHVHAHFGTNPVSVVRLAAKLSSITYSFTAHGPDEFDAPLALDLPGKIAEAGFVAGVSSFGRSQLMRWSSPSHWDRIQVVRCAVAPHFLQHGAAGTAGLETRHLTCVARLNAQKGLPLLLDAAARIADTHDFVIDVIGDGEGRAGLEEQIVRLGLSEHVRLLGWRSSDEVRDALSASRAMVLPSFAEGLPVVLMEALALGRPVIATSIAGIPELVDHANGWLVPAGSVEALAAAMKAVLDAPQAQLAAMGQVGRERVLAMHDPDINARYLAGLLTPFL